MLDMEVNLNSTEMDNSPLATVLLTSYMAAVILIGVIGNIFVIYATFKYTTFGLDKPTMAFIKNLAIADLGVLMLRGVPALVTHYNGRWVLGSLVCKGVGIITVLFSRANMSFTAIIGIHRMLRCTVPQKLMYFGKNHTSFVVLSMWGFAALPNIIFAISKIMPSFHEISATCFIMSHCNPTLFIILILHAVIPLTCSICSSVVILVITIRHRNGRTTNKVVHLVPLILWTAYTPMLSAQFMHRKYDDEIPTWVYNLLHHLYFISNSANPIIYCVVNKKFNVFVRKTLNNFKQYTIAAISNSKKYFMLSSHSSQ